jgi:hypothetical protein
MIEIVEFNVYPLPPSIISGSIVVSLTVKTVPFAPIPEALTNWVLSPTL